MIDYNDKQESNLYESDEDEEDTPHCRFCGRKLEKYYETYEYCGYKERKLLLMCPVCD